MNVYDSARMADVLAPLGYRAVERPDDADMVILNTCHIREHAAEKVFSELGRLRLVKQERRRQGADLIIAVAGCVAQAEGAGDYRPGALRRHRLRAADLSSPAGNGGQGQPRRRPRARHGFSGGDEIRSFAGADRPRPGRIPVGAGRAATSSAASASFPIPAVPNIPAPRPLSLAEAGRLVEAGVRELTLLGQNVNAYHGDGPDGANWGLGRLIRALAEMPGIDRLRYTTSHPRDMDGRSDRRAPRGRRT